MCIFTGTVREVSSTRIFARMVRPGWQGLAYQARVGADRDLAMVLALPVVTRLGERALRFVDLSGAPDLFHDLAKLFSHRRQKIYAAAKGAARPLAVVEVGDYEASFVPTGADFARLDPRFRLSQRLLRALRRQGERGFAVFQLRGDAGAARTLHPLGLRFRTAEPSSLFFPTVHIHARSLPDAARFDHVLYAQGAAVTARTPVGRSPDFWLSCRARGLLDVNRPVTRRTLRGERANTDVRIPLADAH